MATIHQALNNPDILHQIFEEFTLYQPCQKSSDYPRIIEGLLTRPCGIDIRSRTLASAALVCKTFSEPASRVLWAVLYEGVEPLFRAFSAFKVAKAVDHSNDRMSGFSAGLSNTDHSKIEWDESLVPTKTERARCAYLATRVRCFVYCRNYDGRWVRPPCSALLFESLINGSLFPNIQILHYPALHRYHSENEFLRILLASTLEAYSIPRRITSDINTFSETLASIAVVCRNLQHIRVDFQSWHPSRGISLEGFQNLQSAHIDHASSCEEVLRMLNGLVRLESLMVTFLGHFESSLQSPLSVSLPRLHILDIHGAHIYTIHQLISSLTTPLTTVHVNMGSACLYSEFTQLISALCAPRNVISLHTLNLSLTIIDRLDGISGRNRPGSFLRLVAPLLRLHSLTSLTVHALLVLRGPVIQDASADTEQVRHSALAIDDVSTNAMANAWPRLRHLTLTRASQGFPRDGALVHPSLSALVKLAQACPALEVLAMHVADVDRNELESLEEQAGADGRQQTALLEIHPGCNHNQSRPVDPKQPHLFDVDRLAAVLHRLFPKLRGAKLSPPSSEDDPSTRSLEYWEVDRLLEKLYALSIDASTP